MFNKCIGFDLQFIESFIIKNIWIWHLVFENIFNIRNFIMLLKIYIMPCDISSKLQIFWSSKWQIYYKLFSQPNLNIFIFIVIYKPNNFAFEMFF
jgi:hypothetical protein